MTSEPDSTARRRPPTIDLTATEIGTGQSARDTGGPGTAGTAGNGADAASWRTAAIGAGAGALAMAIIGLALWFAGAVPSGTTASATNGQSASDNTQLANKLDQIRTELQTRQPETALASRLTGVEAQTKVLNDALAAINRRLDEIAVAAKTEQERASEALQAAKSIPQSAVQRSDLDALAARIASIESNIRTLSANVTQRQPSANDRPARAALAAEALRATVERGVPYDSELAAVKALGVGSSAAASLEPFAANGVPAASTLTHELSLLMPALEKAAVVTSSDGSFLDRLEGHARDLVRITPIDAPGSDRPSSVIERLRTDIARADLGAAVADIARLPQAAKSLAAPWVQKVNTRDAALAASRKIVAAALAGLSGANTQ